MHARDRYKDSAPLWTIELLNSRKSNDSFDAEVILTPQGHDRLSFGRYAQVVGHVVGLRLRSTASCFQQVFMTTRASLARGQGQQHFEGRVRKWERRLVPATPGAVHGLWLLKWQATGLVRSLARSRCSFCDKPESSEGDMQRTVLRSVYKPTFQGFNPYRPLELFCTHLSLLKPLLCLNHRSAVQVQQPVRVKGNRAAASKRPVPHLSQVLQPTPKAVALCMHGASRSVVSYHGPSCAS